MNRVFDVIINAVHDPHPGSQADDADKHQYPRNQNHGIVFLGRLELKDVAFCRIPTLRAFAQPVDNFETSRSRCRRPDS